MYFYSPCETILNKNDRPTIMGTGSAFSNQNNPAVVVQVGTPGSTGLAEISGILFKTRGPGTIFWPTIIDVILISCISPWSDCG